MYIIENNAIQVDEKNFKFSKMIKHAVELKGVVVVRLELMGVNDDINNLYGIKDGAVIWQVQDTRAYDPNPIRNHPRFAHDPYSGVGVYDKNPELLIATSVQGYRYLINPENGQIVGEESWVK